MKWPWTPPIAAVLALCFATAPRLHYSAQLHGWIDGAERTERFVSDKWSQPSHHRGREPEYWIEVADRRRELCHSIRMEPDAWAELNKDNRVEVVFLPNDPATYHPRGIGFSQGNVCIDLGLLVLEFAAIGFDLFRVIRTRSSASVPDENVGGWAEAQ